jgi:hypothetical protein
MMIQTVDKHPDHNEETPGGSGRARGVLRNPLTLHRPALSGRAAVTAWLISAAKASNRSGITADAPKATMFAPAAM